ncbi:MAG: hypothetical protein M0Z36_00410, partial [Thermaerobacter sp.]|nr:hypothetical protein [Thermaerobacter sp.]
MARVQWGAWDATRPHRIWRGNPRVTVCHPDMGAAFPYPGPSATRSAASDVATVFRRRSGSWVVGRAESADN